MTLPIACRLILPPVVYFFPILSSLMPKKVRLMYGLS